MITGLAYFPSLWAYLNLEKFLSSFFWVYELTSFSKFKKAIPLKNKQIQIPTKLNKHVEDTTLCFNMSKKLDCLVDAGTKRIPPVEKKTKTKLKPFHSYKKKKKKGFTHATII